MRVTKFLLLLIATMLLTECGGAATTKVVADDRAVADTEVTKPSPSTASSSQTDGLAITCNLDDTQRQVTCEASGYAEDARLNWWTNLEQAEAEGETFEFTIANLRPDLSVSVEECNRGSCQTVTTMLDTAHLMPLKPADKTSPRAKPSPSPTSVPTPAETDEPAIHCSLDDSVPKVSCTATGLKDGARVRWSSNASGTWDAQEFEFALDEEWKLVAEIQIVLEVCHDSSCETLETVIDAAHLVQAASTPPAAPPPPPAQKLILPFQIADSYNAAETSYGELSYAGGFVIGAYGGGFGADVWRVEGMKNPDFLLELVPGTVLLASGSGTVGLVQQDYYEGEINPEGVYNSDWELLLYLDDGLYFVIYDHLVDLLVEDGQRVEQGDPLARGRPARVGNQDCWEEDPECRILSTKRPVDWLEWGLKRMVGPNGEAMEGGEPWSVCWEPFLTPEHQQFLQAALVQMALLDFRSGDSACLTDEFRDDHSSDTLTSW